jgi:hypothetical protein
LGGIQMRTINDILETQINFPSETMYAQEKGVRITRLKGKCDREHGTFIPERSTDIKDFVHG